MADQRVKVIAIFKVKPESRDWAIENVFKKIVEETRKEEGNISYILHNDLKEKNSFIFFEEFRSQADLVAHAKAPHSIEARTKLKDHLIAVPDIRIIRPQL